MKAEKLYENFEKLNEKERIKFLNKINKVKDIDYLLTLETRALIAKTLMSITDENGKSYYNLDWLAKNIIGLEKN